MNKFTLWFPNNGESAMVRGKSAYVCVANPFDNGTGQHDLVKPDGRILLCHETASADECCQQIDSLIVNLEGLKAEARRKFTLQEQEA